MKQHTNRDYQLEGGRMTKTLTEQWKNGELIFGKTYWCSDDEGNVAKLVLVNEDRFYEWTLGAEATKDVKKVLSAVPTYDEYRKLKKQLEMAKEALSFYSDPLFMEQGETARKALKEMEGVK